MRVRIRSLPKMKKDNEKNTAEDFLSDTNGDRHNLIPDEPSWLEDAKEEMEDFIESQGIHIRQ